MFLRHINLRNFRNHTDTKLDFNDNISVFVGGNGEGKTNILEAVFYLTSGRSHRTFRDAELLRWGEDAFTVKAEVERRGGKTLIEIYYSSPRNAKKIKMGGVEQKKLSDLFGKVNAVIFAPEDLFLLKGGPAERRRFLDFAASQASPQYFFYLQKYHHVLQQRNRLLKLITVNGSKPESLEIWDEQLVEYASQVTVRRLRIIDAVQEILRPVHARLTDNGEMIKIAYLPSVKTGEEFAESLRSKLKSSRRDELARGYTLFGPHRDDFALTINNIDARVFASQGQQRTAVLSLKLAEAEFIRREREEYPILLLDDVMSELDDRRREFLLHYVNNRMQTLITSTNLNPFQASGRIEGFAVYRVKNGEVSGLE